MDLDAVMLSRIQFAMTIGFHYIFPSISIGLAWLVVLMEGLGWRKGDAAYVQLGKFFGKLFAMTFAMGVATGITMEFQFGTNWAQYAKFVGDIFGAPLAAEAILSFFLESTFLGLYLFGRGRVSQGLHWFSILMVAVGATLSAFWILVANSWQQTPAGYMFNAATGRAELTSFFLAVFNPSMIVRFLHVFDAALIAGAFFVAGIAAYRLLKDNQDIASRKALRLAVIVAFVTSCLEIMPLGHHHAVQVAKYQPEKLAAMEGLFDTGPNAPLTIFGIPTADRLLMPVRIPGLLSLLVSNHFGTVVKGLNDFPPDERPPVVLPFVGFHGMVGLGMLFMALGAYGIFQLWRGTLYQDRLFLRVLIPVIPLPVIAAELGWITTEVGRQPWIVYHLLKTKDAISMTVSTGEIVFSLVLFALIYALLGVLYVYLLVREVRRGPQPEPAQEDAASWI